jgi:HEAT repeat protein
MNALLVLVLLLSPETERLLLGESPFFRHEGMERARAEGDTELLLNAARSPLWDVRRCAAEGLGPRTPPELLKDPVAVVREAAARALGTAAPEEALLSLLNDRDDAVRAEALWALRASPSKRAVQSLLDDPSPTVRTAALAVTGAWGRLRTQAARDELELAIPALIALGRQGGPGDAAFLVGRLRAAIKRASKEPGPLYLRQEPTADIALARALGEMARRGVALGSGTVTDEMRKLVATSDLHAPGALLLAELAAGARDENAAGRILSAQLESRKKSRIPNVYLDPGVQGILHAFAREPWPGLAPLLVPLLVARSPAVRVAVAEALCGDAARAALEDEAADVRAAACGRVKDPAALAPLARDRDPLVRGACARALGRIGDPAAAPALALLLNDLDASVRRAAVGALLRVALPGRTEMLLLAALTDEAAEVRGAAAAAIEFLGEEEAVVPRAIAALLAEEPTMRAHALELLERLFEARFPYDPSDPDKGHDLWKAWWDARAERAPKPGAFRYHVEDLRRKGIDLVLVMDATGSMSPVIQSTKRRIEAVIAGLKRVVPDLRVRIVAYRDDGDAFLTIGSPLTHDPRILEDFLACVPAYGGGDTEEAVLAGLKDAIQRTPWREGTQRVIVLFGDAPPHDRDLALVEATCKEFKGMVHAADVGNYGMAEGGAGGGARMPITAFQRIAEWGRGAAVVLTDETALLKSLLVLTLGPNYRTSVETLFGL